jgi:hypothetical protein
LLNTRTISTAAAAAVASRVVADRVLAAAAADRVSAAAAHRKALRLKAAVVPPWEG